MMAKGRRTRWLTRQLLLGHRGAPRVALENTIPSFLAAMELGADGVELDVFMSSDGVPVVIHDEDLKRIAGRDEQVSDLTADELAHAVPAGVPTLGKVLENMPDTSIVNVELKGPGHFSQDVFLKCVLADLTKHQNRLSFIVSSFDVELLKKLRQYDGHVTIGLLYDKDDFRWSTVLKHSFMLHPKTLHLRADTVKFGTIFMSHLLGLKILLWTVNDPNEAKRLYKKGADGIFTDDVALIDSSL